MVLQDYKIDGDYIRISKEEESGETTIKKKPTQEVVER